METSVLRNGKPMLCTTNRQVVKLQMKHLQSRRRKTKQILDCSVLFPKLLRFNLCLYGANGETTLHNIISLSCIDSHFKNKHINDEDLDVAHKQLTIAPAG